LPYVFVNVLWRACRSPVLPEFSPGDDREPPVLAPPRSTTLPAHTNGPDIPAGPPTAACACCPYFPMRFACPQWCVFSSVCPAAYRCFTSG
jgi:hypothetical protein